ncbi:bidirectional sugar transporter SWEET16-like [Primulina huaijiensis]|uniref:bidirectional sugar transporter SWEET16-like n=1 Tax=Primulina huaijiensis TaxID=1492673 RepID=UPI003CC77F48
MANLSFILGIIGNVVSILMFASPMKTFKQIVKKKSTENYKGVPYITTLLSTSLWSYYGLLKSGGLLIVTVNGAGAALHVIYVTLFLFYASNIIKIKYMKLVAAINIGFLGAVILVTQLAFHGSLRLTLIGILCAALTIGMYAAPLAAMKTVIQMKSVKYMPFFLSFFQFLNGGIWSAYAVLIKDFYIGVPNGIGFLLGSAQLILYAIYKNKSIEDPTEEEGSAHLFEGVIQMHDFNESMKNRSLSKGKSLPKPSVARQYNQNITKTSSMSPYELEVLKERDIEKGFQEIH